MINRYSSRFFSKVITACVLAFAGGLLLNSCTSTESLPAAQDFATIRVLNMIASVGQTASTPIDVYVYPTGPNKPAFPVINALSFGQASVYTNNLPVGNSGSSYTIVVSPLHDSTKVLIHKELPFIPGHHYSLVVYRDPANANNYISDTLEDAPADLANGSGAKTNTYVRFLNTLPGSNLQLRLNDPVNGLPIGGGVLFSKNTGYVAVPWATDTSYTFFVTNSGDNTIIARLAFQSFSPGSFHTITYNGDSARIQPNNPDSANATYRLRVYDDNNLGNDQTFPIPLSFRYNIINGYFATSVFPAVDYIDYLVNNEGDPKFHSFAFTPIPSYGIAAQSVYIDGTNNVYNTFLKNGTLTDAVELKGVRVDNAYKNLGPVFDVHVPNRSKIFSDQAYSFVVYDTVKVASATLPLDTNSGSFKMLTVQLPDQSVAGAARMVFVNGMAPVHGLSGTAYYFAATLKVSGQADTAVVTKALPAKTVVYDQAAPASGTDVTINTTIGFTTTQVPGPSYTFHAMPGGVYEVVILGQRPSPNDPNPAHPLKILVLRINAAL